jgi:hypothetical protein
MWGQLIDAARVQPQGAAAGRNQFRLRHRVAAGEQGYFVPLPDKFFRQIGDDPLRTTISLRRNAFVERRYLCDAHVGPRSLCCPAESCRGRFEVISTEAVWKKEKNSFSAVHRPTREKACQSGPLGCAVRRPLALGAAPPGARVRHTGSTGRVRFPSLRERVRRWSVASRTREEPNREANGRLPLKSLPPPIGLGIVFEQRPLFSERVS